MIDLFIFTTSYPYESGEQFFDNEIQFWNNANEFNVTVFPRTANGNPKDVPSNISVDLGLTKFSFFVKAYSKFASWFSILFIKELIWQKNHKKLNRRNFKIARHLVTNVIRINYTLKKRIKGNRNTIILYNYWFDATSYACGLLRRGGLVNHNVARAHGFDVYENRRRDNYMPVKRQFAFAFDMIFPISNHGLDYLRNQYSIPEECLSVSRLGVFLSGHTSSCSAHGRIHIVSISYCVSVKRIDRIIDALQIAAERFSQDIRLSWTHIGDGILRNDLEKKASESLRDFHNINYKFLGHLNNSEVLAFLQSENIDAFINTSESEGVPVTIMEAMSFGIPAIAPSVGGIPEIVSNKNGVLLAEMPTNEEIAKAILSFDHYRNEHIRREAQKTVMAKYNAITNYSYFINEILRICKTQA
jgi:colanic acid/amylovoran biosynthesis glycosyltransferase